MKKLITLVITAILCLGVHVYANDIVTIDVCAVCGHSIDKCDGHPNDKPIEEPNDKPLEKPNDKPLEEPNDKPLEEPNDKPIEEEVPSHNMRINEYGVCFICGLTPEKCAGYDESIEHEEVRTFRWTNIGIILIIVYIIFIVINLAPSHIWEGLFISSLSTSNTHL